MNKPSKSEMEATLGYDLEQWQYDSADWCDLCDEWNYTDDDGYPTCHCV